MSLAELRRTTRAALCLECGKCSTMCPLATFGDFSASRLAAIHDAETAAEGGASAVQRCLTCGSCQIRCPAAVHFTDFVLGLRAEVPDHCRQPCPHGEAFQAAARLSVDLPSPARSRDWLGEELQVAEEGELALFVGCLPLFEDLLGEELGIHPTEIARAAVELLNRFGVEPVLLAEERCCGHDLLWSGDRGDFEALARANVEAFKHRGIRRILTTCAECCRTWRIDYAELVPDYRPRVQHLSEYLAERLEEGDVEFRAERSRVTYQDPCRLGRHLGVYEAPRRLLESIPGTRLVEMEGAGADALCCGSPGFIHCDSASRSLQSRRLDNAADTGAQKMLTACPKCLIHFACAQHEDRLRQRQRRPIVVEDLTVFTAKKLQIAVGAGTSRPSQQEGEKP